MARHNSRNLYRRHVSTGMQGAFLISILLALVALTHTSLAQESSPPVTQSVPDLKLWWKADNIGYGADGMTWVDGINNGKGVLVVSTPKGVQTWQNRYVWDTVNIFTWEGGSAVLRKGDFNGDGVTDYADLKGNIYKGNANRFPELTKANIVFLPIVADMNNDGLDDMLAYTARGNLILYLGHKILDSIPTTRIEVPMPFDTTHTGFAGVFTRANGGVRFVFTRRLPAGSPTADPYYTMYSVEWAANKPVFTQIDQVLSGKEAAYDVCRLQPVLGKNYFIFREGLNTPSISIYDLSNDKLEKLITKKMDAVSILATLNHSIDGDSAKDFIIMERQSDGLDRVFYSGANPSELRPIGKYKALNHGTTLNIVSTDDATGDGIPDVIVPWATPDYWRWSFLYGPGSLTSVNSVTVSDAANTVLGISQDPVQPDLLRVGIDVEKDGIYEFSIINIRGSVLLKRDMQLSSGKQQILLDVSNTSIPSGRYALKVVSPSVSLSKFFTLTR